MSKTTKNYIGGGAREVKFGDGGSLINVDLKLEDLNNLPVSERGYIRLVVAPRKDTDQFGNTHSIYENTFVPDKSKAPATATKSAPSKPTISGPAKYGAKAPF